MKIGAFVPFCDRKMYTFNMILDALLGQTRQPDVIWIIANTKNPQLYYDSLDNYPKKDNRINIFVWSSNFEVIFKDFWFPSLCVNREIALRFAKMFELDWIFFTDSDIEPPPNCIERMLEVGKPIMAPKFYNWEGTNYIFKWEAPIDKIVLVPGGNVFTLSQNKGVVETFDLFTGFGCIMLKNTPMIHEIGIYTQEIVKKWIPEEKRLYHELRKRNIPATIITDLECRHHKDDGTIGPPWLQNVEWYK